MNQRKLGQCPFLKQECIAERCQLWYAIDFAQVSQLAPVAKRGQARGCIFLLLAFILQMPELPIPPSISKQ